MCLFVKTVILLTIFSIHRWEANGEYPNSKFYGERAVDQLSAVAPLQNKQYFSGNSYGNDIKHTIRKRSKHVEMKEDEGLEFDDDEFLQQIKEVIALQSRSLKRGKKFLSCAICDIVMDVFKQIRAWYHSDTMVIPF